MKALITKIRRILRNRRTRLMLSRTVSIVAAFVVFVTTYALVLPAITMEKDARCGIEAHQHDDSCYELQLTCTQEEADGHVHTEDCYQVEQVLTCEIPEHQHSAENGCNDEEGNLVCTETEHVHDSQCYQENRELVCELEESGGHHHDESCYEKVLICGKQVHTHGPECYEDDAGAADPGFTDGEGIVGPGTVGTESGGNESGQGNFGGDDQGGDVFDGQEYDFGTGDQGGSQFDQDPGNADFGGDDFGGNEFEGRDDFSGGMEFIDAEPGGDSFDGGENWDADFTEETVFTDSEPPQQLYEEPYEEAYQEPVQEPYEEPVAEEAPVENGALTGGQDDQSGEGPAPEGNPAEGDEAEAGQAGDQTVENAESAGTETDAAAADQDAAGQDAADPETADLNENQQALDNEIDKEAEKEAGEKTEAAEHEDDKAGDREAAENTDNNTDNKEETDNKEADKKEAGQDRKDDQDTSGTADSAKSNTGASPADKTDTKPESTGYAAETMAADAYVPALDALDFNAILDKNTGIYYHAVEEDGVIEDSSLLCDWEKVKKDTELAPNDLLRIYLSYTIPAGSLNATNDIARYRLPGNIHLSDAQKAAINGFENGISGQYMNYDALEITDPGRHTAYIGAEAVEGRRRPGQTVEEYLAGLDKNEDGTDPQELISAVVRTEDVCDAEGSYIGTDLVFTFSTYTVDRNQHEYDKDGNQTKAGEKVCGWFCFDLNTSQIDWATVNVEESLYAVEAEGNDIDNNNAEENGIVGNGAEETGADGNGTVDGGAAENDAAAAGRAEAPRAEETLPEREEAAADQASAQKAAAEAAGADDDPHTTEARDENTAENADHTGSADAVQGAAEDNSEASEASSVDAEKAENSENVTAAETAETVENTENAEAAETTGTVENTENAEAAGAAENVENTEAAETAEALADEQAADPQAADPSAQTNTPPAPEIVHATYQIVTTKEAEIIFAAAVMDEETGSEKEPISTKLVLKVTEFETRDELREPSADDPALAAGEAEPEQTDETDSDAKPGDGAAGDSTQDADAGEDAENKKDAETENTDADKENADEDKAAETDKQDQEETVNYPAATFEDTITVHMGTLSTDTDSAAGLDIPERTELIVHVEADEGTFPEGTTMVLTAVTGNDLDDVAQAVEGAVEGKTKGFYAVDITFKNADGKVIEPRKPVKVTMKGEPIRKATENASTEPVVVHLEETAASAASGADQADNGQAEIKPEEPERTELEKDGTTAAENADNADESAKPAAEAGNVSEIDQTSGTDKEPALEETQENVDASADAGEEKVLDQNAEADHPAEAELPAEAVEEDAADSGNTVETAEEKPATAPTATVVETYRQNDTGKAADDKTTNDTIMFEGDSFSIYAIVYTVDFHYEVNGKTYEFSIPGGGFVSLEHIVEVLGIARIGENGGSKSENQVNEGENASGSQVYNAGDDTGVEENGANASTYGESINLNHLEVSEATKKFVADVANVEFSSPELVWVGKAEDVTTVGGLKEANGLEVQYSAELTEEQIAEINGTVVESGDWALISMLPFSSEESLTVTMENGDQFVVKVTDAQKPYKDVESLENGTYIIYNSFDSSKQAFFMKNDGTSYLTNSTTGVGLNEADLSNFTWKVTKNSNGTFTIKSTANNIYINLYGNNNEYDKWASSSSAKVNLVNHYNSEGVNDGISIRYNDKYIQRNQTKGFFVRTDLQWKDVNLTFYKIENSSGGSTGTPGIILTDDERDDLETWKETLEKFNTLTDYDKTAEVYNEDNRIYKVDITANSGVMDFYKDVDLGFVLDVSNSMKFPSSLKALEDSNGNEQQVWMTAEWLNWAKGAYSEYYNRQNCFYILSDPALTSTIYKVYLDGTQWKYQDASEPAGSKIFNINDGTVFKEPYRQAYTLYYADDTKDRFTYLKDSVAYAIETLHKIVKPTEHVDDETASVRLAYNFFCKQITKSDSFKDLRNPANVNYTIPLEYRYTDSGTQQNIALYDGKYNPANWWTSPDASDGLSANEFGWDTSSDQYVILVTDGAPNGPTMNDVRTAAANLKAQYPNVKVFTIGLSTKDVDGGSKMLYDIADTVGGVRQFYEAEKAKDLEHILLKILQTIMAKGLAKGTITDTIDRTFYPVDINGNPLSVGVYNSNGKIDGAQISEYVTGGRPTTAHANESFYTWEQVGDEWKITWYNQEIGWDDNDSTTGNPWTGTVYVKAREDYLGGNLIATNDGNAQIEPTGIKLVINGTPETDWRSLENMPKIDLPVPRVNVHNLESKGNSTTWTIYKGTTVTPAEQIKALWNNILIEEVVSATDGGNHKVTTGESANVGTSGSGEMFKLVDLLAEFDCRTTNGAAFDIDTLINSLGTGVNASVTFNPIIYNAYGHESGTITVTLKREAGTATLTQHNADTVGEPVEKYSLTVTYQPYSESVREEKILTNQESGYTDKSNHHNGAAGRGTEETGAITSVNTHTINVFQKGIRVTKIDKTNPSTVLPGAVFELFRVDPTGTADVSAYKIPPGKYSKAGGDLTTDSNGIIMINPAIPDKDTAVTDKTVYEPNISVGETENITHDTVFYLVEKTAPTVGGTTYSRMPGAIRFTMTLTENKGTDSTTILYDWTQTASIAAAEYLNGAEYLDEDIVNTATGTNSDIYAYTLKNGKPTDITLIKVDKATQNSISGAKFRLLRGSENVDLTDSALTITAINGGATVTPEDYDFNSTTIKVVTVPEGGIRIAGLVDGTYTLIEVSAPAGYIITDSGKTFKTENGAIKNSDDTAHANEAGNIAFEVENEPGVELPATGGSGTGLLYLMGILLTALAGAGLVLMNSRRADG